MSMSPEIYDKIRLLTPDWLVDGRDLGRYCYSFIVTPKNDLLVGKAGELHSYLAYQYKEILKSMGISDIYFTCLMGRYGPFRVSKPYERPPVNVSIIAFYNPEPEAEHLKQLIPSTLKKLRSHVPSDTIVCVQGEEPYELPHPKMHQHPMNTAMKKQGLLAPGQSFNRMSSESNGTYMNIHEIARLLTEDPDVPASPAAMAMKAQADRIGGNDSASTANVRKQMEKQKELQKQQQLQDRKKLDPFFQKLDQTENEIDDLNTTIGGQMDAQQHALSQINKTTPEIGKAVKGIRGNLPD